MATLVVGVFVAAGCGGSSTRTSATTNTARSAPLPAPSASLPLPSATNTAPSAALPLPSATNTAQSAALPLPPVTINLSVVGLLPAPERGTMPVLPKGNTCDGANTWPSFTWSKVPRGTAELALFIVNFRPVNETIFVDWVVAGLSPSLTGISAGRLPPGAIVGRNGFGKVGYSICPPKGTSESYIARLVALSHPLHPQPGFDGLAYYTAARGPDTTTGLEGAGQYSR
jgi:phosphatidylethanolamine-binding protein (PEBP) family uncharacterized protein